MVTVQVQSPDLDDRLTLEYSTVQIFSPFFASSSIPAHGTLGTRAESGDRALGDMLDDFGVPAIAGGTVSALSGAIHLLCRSAFGRDSVSREELACSPVPGRNHDRVTAQLDGQASLRTVLQRPDPGRHHHRDTAQPDSHASLLAVLQCPVPGQRHHRDNSPVPGRIHDRDCSPLPGLPRGVVSAQSAAAWLLDGPPIGGGIATAQAAALSVQSHVRRVIARRHIVQMLEARERDAHECHQARAAAACTMQASVRGPCEGRHRHRLQTCIRPAGAHMHGRLVDDAYVTSLVPMVSARCAGRPRSGGATVLALAATRMMRRWNRPGPYPNTTWPQTLPRQLRSSCSLTCDASSYVSA